MNKDNEILEEEQISSKKLDYTIQSPQERSEYTKNHLALHSDLIVFHQIHISQFSQLNLDMDDKAPFSFPYSFQQCILQID